MRGLMLVLLLCAAGARVPAQGLADAREAIRSGKYAEGIAALQKVPRADSTWIAVQRELAQALALTGKYDNAEQVARAATAARARAPSPRQPGSAAGRRAPRSSRAPSRRAPARRASRRRPRAPSLG